MTCTRVRLGDGATAIVCQRRLRTQPVTCACGVTAARLCDYPTGPRGRTCNRPVCALHATRVGKDRDLCPEHAVDWRGGT